MTSLTIFCYAFLFDCGKSSLLAKLWVSPCFCQYKWKLTSETFLTPKTSKTKACSPEGAKASTGNFCSSGEYFRIWWARREVGAKYFAAVATARTATAILIFAVCRATVKRQYFYYWHQELSSSWDSYERKPTFSDNCFPCYFKHLPLLLSITISSFRAFAEHFRSQYWEFKVL